MWFLSFFTFARNNWQLIALVIAALLLVALVVSWDARGREIDELNVQIDQYKESIRQVNEANRTLTERLVQRNDETARQADLIGRVRNAPQSEDGSVAPVLRNALDGLRQDRERQQRRP